MSAAVSLLALCRVASFTTSRCSVAGTVHGDDIFVAGPRQDVAKMGTTLKKRCETRDQMMGPKPGDQKELHILNRTLRWARIGSLGGI